MARLEDRDEKAVRIPVELPALGVACPGCGTVRPLEAVRAALAGALGPVVACYMLPAGSGAGVGLPRHLTPGGCGLVWYTVVDGRRVWAAVGKSTLCRALGADVTINLARPEEPGLPHAPRRGAALASNHCSHRFTEPRVTSNSAARSTTRPTCNPATGACNLPKTNGTPCPDSDLCDGTETCSGGSCAAGTTVDCSGVTDPCLQTACNPATGACNLPSPISKRWCR